MSDDTDTAQVENEEKPSDSFMSHLLEMRDRVMRMMLAILLIFLSLFYWANEIYTFLAKPLISHLPEGSSMIAIDVASPFLTPFKLVLMLSIFLAMPVILFQLWAFVAPGLYKHEKRLAVPLLISSVGLFYLGIAFAYFVVFPLVFGFFTSIGPESVSIATDIGRYLDFVLSIFFGFGLAFEVPVATIIIIALGMTTPEKLAEKRPYVVVAAFVVGMLLTPPDIISQLLLAIPMWLLFECGLIAAKYLLPEKMITRKELAEAENSIGGEEAATPTAAAATAGGSIFGEDYEVVKDPADTDPIAPAEKINSSNTIEETSYEAEYDENDDDDYDNNDEEDYQALSEEEMDAELDRMDDDEDDDEDDGGTNDKDEVDQDKEDDASPSDTDVAQQESDSDDDKKDKS